MKKTTFLFAFMFLLSAASSFVFGADNAAAAGGKVARSQFTTGVSNREPVDSITTASATTKVIYFFTELQNLSGQTITHRWEYNGNFMSAVSFDVKGPHWRVWSNKMINLDQTGDWKVTVLDKDGNSLGESSFTYTKP